jgi:hypothetical protein
LAVGARLCRRMWPLIPNRRIDADLFAAGHAER